MGDMMDYQKLAGKSTSIKERSKLGIGDIFSNAATCLLCGETIRSMNRHDFRTCNCKNLSVDGGSWYLKRISKKKDSYKNVVVYYDEVEED